MKGLRIIRGVGEERQEGHVLTCPQIFKGIILVLYSFRRQIRPMTNSFRETGIGLIWGNVL